MIKRSYFNKLTDELHRNEALILVGPRQVGKTTLMQELTKLPLVKNSHAFYNMELITELNLFSSGYEAIINELKTRYHFVPKKEESQIEFYLFIDEFHYINNATSLFKAFFDTIKNLKIIASGSSSLKIHEHLKESLTGRKKIWRIFPLNFDEILNSIDFPLYNLWRDTLLTKPLDPYHIQKISLLYQEYLCWGGMPKIYTLENPVLKKEELQEIYQSYIQKDVRSLIKGEDIATFNKLVELYVSQVSGLLNVDNLAKAVKTKYPLLNHMLDILEGTYVITRLKPYYTDKKKELSKAPKGFFYDNGIVNWIRRDFSPVLDRENASRWVENSIFKDMESTLETGFALSHWRTQQQTEVDFVLRKDREIIPIEVKNNEVKSIIPTNIKAFCNNYPRVKKAVVLNKSRWEILSFQNNNLTLYILPHFCATRLGELFSNED